MNELISVIIPVYNVAEYLEKSLISIIEQTYKNIQVIIIDDGSTDNSGKICDQYCEKDERFEVYHIQNGGVSNARNKGMDYSRGKYIYFLDPDDFLERDTLEILYNHIKTSLSDLVECSYYKKKSNMKESIIHLNAEISSEDAIQSLLLWNGYITSFCWDKLYIREKIGEIRFDTNLRVGEDDLFVFQYLLQCKKVSVIDRPLYNYLIRENSAIGNVYTEKKKDSVRAALVVHEICKEQDFSQKASRIHVSLAAFFSYANLLNTIPYKKINQYDNDCKFYSTYMKMCSYNLLIRTIGVKSTILYKLAQYCPNLYKITGIIRNKSR